MDSPPRIERLPDVLRRVGISRSTLYARIQQGTFPKPIPLGNSHVVGFLASEIDEWIARHVRAARPAHDPAAIAV